MASVFDVIMKVGCVLPEKWKFSEFSWSQKWSLRKIKAVTGKIEICVHFITVYAEKLSSKINPAIGTEGSKKGSGFDYKNGLYEKITHSVNSSLQSLE